MRVLELILIVVTSTLLMSPASAEDKIKELQRERIAALELLVDVKTSLFKSPGLAPLSLEEVLDAKLLLIDAELDAAETEAERIPLYKKQIEVLKTLEEHATRAMEIARGTKEAVLKAKARRLEAEIRLERGLAKKQAAVQRESTEVASTQAKDVAITRQFVAQIHAGRHIDVHSQLSGYLEEVLVTEGQAVKKGDVLFKLASQLYRPKLDVALAEVALATLAFKNAQRLLENKVVSTEEVERAKGQLGTAQAKAQLAQAELELTVIRAPFDGHIGRLPKQAGSLVTERDILTTLCDNSTMWAEFKVPESDLEWMTALGPDHKADLQLTNGNKFAEPGKISAVAGDVNSDTGTVACRAEFPNREGRLRHGMTVTVLIHQPPTADRKRAE